VPGLAAETVLGLDNAPLTLPVAGVGSRVLAALMDSLLQLVLQIVWLVTVMMPGWRGSTTLGFVVWGIGAFLIDWAYYAGLEIAMHGRTLGKRIVGLRTVARHGGEASAGALMTRNLLRPADLLVGVPMMAIDPLSRRLGDRLAGTIVVYDRAPKDEPLLRRIPNGWQGDDVALVESLLRRVSELEPARADAMARRILDRLEREDPAFLERAGGRGDGPLMVLRRAFDVSEA
jgi:uncharacterized RDD family membrane protein YckC